MLRSRVPAKHGANPIHAMADIVGAGAGAAARAVIAVRTAASNPASAMKPGSPTRAVNRVAKASTTVRDAGGGVAVADVTAAKAEAIAVRDRKASRAAVRFSRWKYRDAPHLWRENLKPSVN